MNTRGGAEGPLRLRSPGASVRALPRRGRGAAVSRRRPRTVPARERAARLPVARFGGVICTSPVGIVARSVSMRSREVEATSRARAWLALALVPGLGPAQARRLAGRAGGPEAARALSPAALAAAGLDAGAWLEAGVRAEHELAQLAALGASLWAWDEAAYPASLRAIADPPLVLAVRGTLASDAGAVAIVGARRASELRAARRGGAGARPGRTSGSRWSAASRPGSTRPPIAARSPRAGARSRSSATGIDRVYPPWHADLSRRGGRRRRAGDGVPVRHGAVAATISRAAIA